MALCPERRPINDFYTGNQPKKIETFINNRNNYLYGSQKQFWNRVKAKKTQ